MLAERMRGCATEVELENGQDVLGRFWLAERADDRSRSPR
jgi:hypothetical protein